MVNCGRRLGRRTTNDDDDNNDDEDEDDDDEETDTTRITTSAPTNAICAPTNKTTTNGTEQRTFQEMKGVSVAGKVAERRGIAVVTIQRVGEEGVVTVGLGRGEGDLDEGVGAGDEGVGEEQQEEYGGEGGGEGRSSFSRVFTVAAPAAPPTARQNEHHPTPHVILAMEKASCSSSITETFPAMPTPRSDFAAVVLREEGKIVVMGGYNGPSNSLSSMESISQQTIDQESQKWTAMVPMMRARWSFGAAIVTTRLPTAATVSVRSSVKKTSSPPPHHQCRHLVVAGGLIDGDPTDSAEVFDLSTNQWTDLPPLQVQRDGCAVISLYDSGILRGYGNHGGDYGGCVYVVGGYDVGNLHASVEWLDMSGAVQGASQGGNSKNVGWRYLPSNMNLGRCYCAAVMVQSSDGNASGGNQDTSSSRVQLVVVGGYTIQEGTTNSVECFDFGRGQWHNLPRMTERREGCAAVVIGCRIFVVGGEDGSGNIFATAEYFDFGMNCWTRVLPTMSVPRWSCTAVVLMDNNNNNNSTDNNGDSVCRRLVVLGGCLGDKKIHSSVEVLDIHKAPAVTSPTASRRCLLASIDLNEMDL